ncbi:MAG: hypothetical protein ACI9OJ_004668 [Myxococcota bacterium]|jgi:hypothetical protein
MSNVTVTGTGGTTNYGMYNITGSLSIRGSSITGGTNSILNDNSLAKVADTNLDGAVTGGGFTCVGVYDLSFVALSTICA